MNVSVKIQQLKERAGQKEEVVRDRGPKRPPLPVQSQYQLDAVHDFEVVASEKPAKVGLELGRKIREKLQSVRSVNDPFSRRLQRLN